MYKLKTGRHFERCNANDPRPLSFAVVDVQICSESRLLLVAGEWTTPESCYTATLYAGAHGQISLFRFLKVENAQDISVIRLPQLCSVARSRVSGSPPRSPAPSSAPREQPPPGSGRAELKRQRDTVGTSCDSQQSSETSIGSQSDDQQPIKVRGGTVRRPAGYQVSRSITFTAEEIHRCSLNSSVKFHGAAM